MANLLFPYTTPIFLPEKFHGQRNLACYSPCSCKEYDMTGQLRPHNRNRRGYTFSSLQLSHSVQFSSAQSLTHVRLFVTPKITARQASLSITNSWSSLKLMSIKSVMPSNHLILCHPLLLLPSVFPSIRNFSNESSLHIRWPKYWSFSFNISPSNEHPGLSSFRIDWLDLLAVQGTKANFI